MAAQGELTHLQQEISDGMFCYEYENFCTTCNVDWD